MQVHHATDPQALREVSEICHDAWVDEGEVSLDTTDRCLTVPFRQEARAWGGQPQQHLVRQAFFYSEYLVEFMHCRLVVRQVEDVWFPEEWGDSSNMLLSVDFDSGEKAVELMLGIDRIRATVRSLDVEVTISDEQAGQVRRRVSRRRLFPSESDRPLW